MCQALVLEFSTVMYYRSTFEETESQGPRGVCPRPTRKRGAGVQTQAPQATDTDWFLQRWAQRSPGWAEVQREGLT